MKKPNNYGGVAKLSGNRRKPYMAYINEKVVKGIAIPPKQQKSLQHRINALYDIDNTLDVAIEYAKIKHEIEMLQKSDVEFKENAVKELNKLLTDSTFKVYPTKKAIGYYATSKEAHIALAEHNKNPLSLTGRDLTFKAVYELAYKDSDIDSKSKVTHKAYKSGFDKCKPIHDMPIATIKLTHLEEIIDSMSGMSLSTQANAIMVMKLVYNYAMKHDLVYKDHSIYVRTKDIAEPNARNSLTRDKVQFLWDNKDWKLSGTSAIASIEVAKVLLILCYTGMRINELLNLKSEDVKGDFFYVGGTKTSAAKRIIPIHPSIKSLISTDNEYVISANGKKVKYSSFVNLALKQFKATFDFDYTFHEMRHTFSTYSTGMDSVLRKYMMGHKSQDITNDVYTHPEVLRAELIEEIKKLKIVEKDG